MSKGETVLALREAGLSNKQIAAALDMPVPSVRRLASTSAKRPAAQFQEQQPPPVCGVPARGGGFAPLASTVQPLPAAHNKVGDAAKEWEALNALERSKNFLRLSADSVVRQPVAAKPTHIIIPDTQCKPGVPLDHLRWAGQYIAERRPDVVVHLGDHWDLPSLSSYESKGSHYFEGKRLKADIDAGNTGLDLLMEGMGGFRPKRMVLLRGNHEDRLTRAINENPTQLAGLVGFGDFNDVSHGWEAIDFLQPIEIDGVTYSHYFPQPLSGRPYGGNIETMIKNIGFTFTCGHTQGLWWGRRELGNGAVRIGLVAGSYYLHDEEYKTVQGNHHWRGLIVKHEVAGGSYDPMMVSIEYLQKRFGGGE